MTTTEAAVGTPPQGEPTPPDRPGPPTAGHGPRLIHADAAARMLRPVRPHLIACTVLSAAGAAAGLAPYVAIAEIARAALNASSVEAVTGTVWTWVGIGAVGALLRLILLALSSRVGHYADAKILHHLRTRIVRRLGVVPLGWFRSAGSGHVKKAMTDDLEEMHHLIAHALGELVVGTTATLVAFGYLLWVDWRLALITAVVPLLMVLSYRVAMRSMSVHLARLIAAETRISGASIEYADGIAVAQTFGSGGGMLGRFDEAVDEHAEAMRTWVAEVRHSSAASQLLSSEMMVLAVVMAAGLGFMSAGGLPAADLLPFLVVGIGLPTSFSPMIQSAQGLRKARMAAGHIEDLLAHETLPEPEFPRRPDGHRIEFDQVSFSYGGHTDAVTGISAVCEPGTVTALVGPSGAGKSTLAALLPRFYDVTGGAIRIGGVDVRQMTSQTLLSSMSLVFQDTVLLRDTVAANIRLARPEATDTEVREVARAAQIHDVIEQLPDGYDTLLESGGGGLSGGERQRLTIARAMISGAPVVVLDEATAALDPDSEAAVQDALSELAAGRTVLVIAHRLHTIARADQILVLEEGRLVDTGTHRQLLSHNGLYARMWRAQQQGDLA